MTAQELIEILQDLDPETEIYVQHTAGDYWKTQLASSIRGGNYGQVEHSSYYGQSKVIEDYSDIDDDEDIENKEEVFLITINQIF